MSPDDVIRPSHQISRRSIVSTGTKLAYSAPIVAVSMKMGLGSAAAVSGGCTTLTANLNGTNEVPPNNSPGTGTLTLVLGVGTVHYDVASSGLVAPVIAAHIHEAPAGVNGPVVIPLAVDDTGTGSGDVLVDQALIDKISGNPAGFYVNVHSSTYPGGEIRDQLSC